MAEGSFKFTAEAIFTTKATLTGQEEGKGCLRSLVTPYDAVVERCIIILEGEHPRPVLQENHRLFQEMTTVTQRYLLYCSLCFCALPDNPNVL